MRRAVAIGVIGLVLGVGVGAQQKSSEIELQTAIRTETVAGDLKKAIAQYEELVRKYGKTDRAVAAQALVHMAECYQKLGDTQARALFERVLREFADQKEPAALATSRLASGKPAPPSFGMVSRQLWSGPGVDPGGTVSLDGRYLSFTDWETGDLAVRDLSTGTNRHLTKKGTWADSADFAEVSTVSRDGAQIAYGWYSERSDRYELRTLRMDSPAGTSPRTVFDNPDVVWIAPFDWSPDGKWLAVQLSRKDRTTQLGIVTVADGAFRALKSVDWRGATRLCVSPDGSLVAYDLPAETGFSRELYVIRADGTREWKVASHPADEIVMGWSRDASTLLFASDRSGSMALWSMAIANGQPADAPRMIKGDIGNVITGIGTTRNGSLLYAVRTSGVTLAISTLDLKSGTLSPPNTPFESYARAIRSPDWSPDGKQLAFIAEQSRARVSLVIATATGERVREVPLTMTYAQRPRWAPDGTITIQGRDLKGKAGFFTVDLGNGEIRPLLVAEDAGVSVLQLSWLPGGQEFLFRRLVEKKTQFVRRAVSAGTERVLAETPHTLAGTSVSPDGQTAAYVVIDRTTRASTLYLVPVDGGSPRELLRLSGPETLANLTLWTHDGRDLVFSRLEGSKATIWTIPVAGGRPHKLGAPQTFGPDMRLHPDGRRVVYATGTNVSEIWTLENFLPAAATKSSRR